MEKVFKRCIDAWGWEAQLSQTGEECAELIVAINHYRRGRISQEKMIEEAVDVYLMVKQMQHKDPESFQKWLDCKLNKLESRLVDSEHLDDMDDCGC